MWSRCIRQHERGKLHVATALATEKTFAGSLARSKPEHQIAATKSEKHAVSILAKTCGPLDSTLLSSRSAILQSRSRAAVALLRIYADSGDVMRAEAWLRTLLESQTCRNVRMFNTVILACARVGDVSRAEYWFFQIIEKQLEPNVYTFNMVLKACAEAGDVFSAHRWMFRMFDVSLCPDAVTFRTLIHTCARERNPQLAEEWLMKMQAASHPLDVVSCSSVMGAYALVDDCCGVERWLARMQDDGVHVDEVGYSIMIHMWATGVANTADETDDNRIVGYFAPSPERAEAWLWKALEAGYRPTRKALHALLDSFVQTGDMEGVERIEKVMHQFPEEPLATVCALKSKVYAASGDYRAVEDLIGNLRERGGKPDAECLRVLLYAYARSKRSPWDKAEMCFRELYELGAFDVSQASYSFTQQQQLLTDLRDAVGRQKFAELSAEFTLPGLSSHASEPRLRRRVAGRCEMILPAASA